MSVSPADSDRIASKGLQVLLEKMADNHGFKPDVVWRVWKLLRDLQATDATLKSMREAAEREAESKLRDVPVHVDTPESGSSVAEDQQAVFEVDFNRRDEPVIDERTLSWAAQQLPVPLRLSGSYRPDEEYASHGNLGSPSFPPPQPDRPLPSPPGRRVSKSIPNPRKNDWTPQEDAFIMAGKPIEALQEIDARRGKGSVARRLVYLDLLRARKLRA